MERLEIKMILKEEIHDKPWGRERWLVQNEKYVSKILEIKKGEMFSLQYHRVKEETWHILKGSLRVTHGEDIFIATPGMTIHVPPGTIHRMEAIEDSEFLEVSTPEIEDVVRLEDKYGRPKEGYEWQEKKKEKK